MDIDTIAMTYVVRYNSYTCNINLIIKLYHFMDKYRNTKT